MSVTRWSGSELDDAANADVFSRLSRPPKKKMGVHECYDHVLRNSLEHGDIPDDDATLEVCTSIAYMFFALHPFDTRIFITNDAKSTSIVVSCVDDAWRPLVGRFQRDRPGTFRSVRSVVGDVLSDEHPGGIIAGFADADPFYILLRRAVRCPGGGACRAKKTLGKTSGTSGKTSTSTDSLRRRLMRASHGSASCGKRYHSMIAMIRCTLSHQGVTRYDADRVAAFWDGLDEDERTGILSIAPAIYPATLESLVTLNGYELVTLLDRMLEGTAMCGVPVAKDVIKVAVDNAHGPLLHIEVGALFAHAVVSSLLLCFSQKNEAALLDAIDDEKKRVVAKHAARHAKRHEKNLDRLERELFEKGHVGHGGFGGFGVFGAGSTGKWWEDEEPRPFVNV